MNHASPTHDADRQPFEVVCTLISGGPHTSLTRKRGTHGRSTSLAIRVRILAAWVLSFLFCICCAPRTAAADEPAGAPRILDLSLTVAADMPGTWPQPGFPPFHINHYLRIGPLSAYNDDILAIDGNTGTQLDVPPHSVPAPETNLPNANP